MYNLSFNISLPFKLNFNENLAYYVVTYVIQKLNLNFLSTPTKHVHV